MAKRQITDQGWVMLRRAVLRSPLFAASPWVLKLYIWLMLRARWKDGEVNTRDGRTVLLRKNQVLVGTEQIERELSWRGNHCTRSAYRSAMAHLVRHHFITASATRKGTIVTVLPFPDPKPASNHTANDHDHGADQDIADETASRVEAQTGETAFDVATNKESTETVEKQGRKKLKEEKGVFDDDTRRFFSDLSLLWEIPSGAPITWDQNREAQILNILDRYTPTQLKRAVFNYGKISKLGEDAYIPRRWTFERFFSAKVLDEVLLQPIDYFRKHSARRTSHLNDIIGTTSLDDYYNGDKSNEDDT